MNRFHKMLLAAFSVIILEILLACLFSVLRIPCLVLLGCEVIVLLVLPMRRNQEKKDRKECRESDQNGDYIQLDQGSVRYKLTGAEGHPTIVLINGFPMPYEIWDRNAGELAKHGFRVLQFDLWGIGCSDLPRAKADADLYVKQIRQLVQKLDLKGPIHIAAFSIGCTIAGRLAETASDLPLGKFILIGPVVNQMPISPFDWPLVGEYFTRLFIHKAMFNIFYGNFNRKERLEALRDVFFSQLQWKGFRKGWLNLYRNLFPKASLHVYSALAKLGNPVQILTGQEDRIVPVKNSELLQQEMGWPLTMVEQGGHSVLYECEEIVNSRILAFLQAESRELLASAQANE